MGVKKLPVKKTRKVKLYFREWYEIHGMGVWDIEKLTELEVIILAIEFEMYCASRGYEAIWDG